MPRADTPNWETQRENEATIVSAVGLLPEEHAMSNRKQNEKNKIKNKLRKIEKKKWGEQNNVQKKKYKTQILHLCDDKY